MVSREVEILWLGYGTRVYAGKWKPPYQTQDDRTALRKDQQQSPRELPEANLKVD